MEVGFYKLMQMYKNGKLDKQTRDAIKRDLEKKEQHAKQMHFKTHDGRTFDLIALKESILEDDRLRIKKLPNKMEKGGF